MWHNLLHLGRYILAWLLRFSRGATETLRGFLTISALKLAVVLGALIYAFIELRILFLQSVPFFVRHAKTVQTLVNGFLDIVALIEDAVKVIVLIIREIINLFRKKRRDIVTNWKGFSHVDTAEIIADMNKMGMVCGAINTGPKASHELSMYFLSDYTCPVVRASYPTFAKNMTETVLGWSAYNPDPHQGANSCQATGDEHTRALCGFLAFGLVLAEIVVPVILVVFLIQNMLAYKPTRTDTTVGEVWLDTTPTESVLPSSAGTVYLQ